MTRDDFVYRAEGSMWDFGPNPKEPILMIGHASDHDGWVATATWPSERKTLRCYGPTAAEAQDRLLESLATPPPPDTVYVKTDWIKPKEKL